MTTTEPGSFEKSRAERNQPTTVDTSMTTSSIDSQAGPRARTEPRRGDFVRVRSRAEILATLDEDGSVDALPFMPEMLEFAGRELPVWARAERTCDTLNVGTGPRRMDNTVHLVGARCTGSAHGGCEAQCLLFWREEWLEWPDEPGKPISAPGVDASGISEQSLLAATKAAPGEGGAYRCQATEQVRASSPIPPGHYAKYLRDVQTRNVGFWVVIRGLLIIAFNRYQRLSRRSFPSWLRIQEGRNFPFIVPTGTGERLPAVEFQPGELVEVRSKEEIMATLGPDQRNRNMHFDEEMLPYCGRRAHVVGKVTRILDETTGKMIKLSDCYVLEDVVCLGLYKRFCQRAILPYWRSAWLRRVDDSAGASPPLPSAPIGAIRRP
jgi:hypothetical protein